MIIKIFNNHIKTIYEQRCRENDNEYYNLLTNKSVGTMYRNLSIKNS